MALVRAQPSTQTPVVGLPLARLVVVICLATGAALDMAVGPHSGKGSGELGLVRSLLKGFRPGDVMHRRCPVLQLFPDRHSDGGRCGRFVRTKRLAHHRHVNVASRWVFETTSCAGANLRRAQSG